MRDKLTGFVWGFFEKVKQYYGVKYSLFEALMSKNYDYADVI